MPPSVGAAFAAAQANAASRAPSPQHLVAFLARHGTRARIVVSVVSLAVLIAFVIPDADDVRAALSRFGDMRWGWLAVALWGQLGVIMGSARFQRRLLRAGGVRLPLREAAAVTAADMALALSVSGGTILGAGYVQRHATRRGGDEGLLTTIAWLTQLLSAALLGAVVVFGTEHPLWKPLPLVSTLATLAGLALLVLAVQQPFVIAAWTDWVLRRVPRIGASTQKVVLTHAARLAQLTLRRRDWGLVLTLGCWIAIADTLSLFASARAVGVHPGLTTTILGYAAVQTAIALPLTPGAIGIVESALWGTAVARHVPRIAALSWTLLYRFLAFWLVLVIGWGCYALLQWQTRRSVRDALGTDPA